MGLHPFGAKNINIKASVLHRLLRFHENVDFASVKRSFWMKNGSRGLAGEGPFWLWDGLSCRPGGTSGCHEYMGIGEKCVHKYLNAVFQARVMYEIAKIGKMWVSLQ